MEFSAKLLARFFLSQSNTGRKLMQCWSLRSHLEDIGWFRSTQEGLPVDCEGNYLPWFTYPAISFLTECIREKMQVFEYGSGNSTFWWSQRVSSVVSYEHDLEWYQSLKERIPHNVEYHYCPLEHGQYCKAIREYNKSFDIVIIDGRDRVDCAKNSLYALRDDGVIIWDNSERTRYREGLIYLKQNGFRCLDFEGHGPINVKQWRTSVLYRRNNCFDI